MNPGRGNQQGFPQATGKTLRGMPCEGDYPACLSKNSLNQGQVHDDHPNEATAGNEVGSGKAHP